VGLGLGLGLPLALGLGLGLGLGLVVPVGATLPVGETLAPGENEDEDGSAVGVDPEQAETAPEASMVMVPQPTTTASLALSPVFAMAMRTFMEPPHAPVPEGGGRPARIAHRRHTHTMT
jgi:pyruvate/2-oxoglutarate dehydrogenase complex dihydrolipoamide acyltransferase (E2) component